MSSQAKIYEDAPEEWLRGVRPNFTLFYAPFIANSATSREAAVSMREKTPSLRARVLEALTICGPMTDEELSEWFQMSGNTIRPRRIELVKVGAVKEYGTKKTRSGRNAVIWGVA